MRYEQHMRYDESYDDQQQEDDNDDNEEEEDLKKPGKCRPCGDEELKKPGTSKPRAHPALGWSDKPSGSASCGGGGPGGGGPSKPRRHAGHACPLCRKAVTAVHHVWE